MADPNEDLRNAVTDLREAIVELQEKIGMLTVAVMSNTDAIQAAE